MKIKINCVHYASLTITLVCSALSGCSTAPSSPLYSSWQERAYGSYNMAVPVADQAPVNPYMTADLRTVQQPKTSAGELMYIAEYYGLH